MCGPAYSTFYSFTEMLGEYEGRSAVKQPFTTYLENFGPDLVVKQETIEAEWSYFLPPEVLSVYQVTAKHATKGKRTLANTVGNGNVSPKFKAKLDLDYRALARYGCTYQRKRPTLRPA